MMPSAVCKICKITVGSFEALKSHWRAEHPQQYVAVKTWLADVDEAVVVADIVAKEGLKGGWAGEETDFGKKRSRKGDKPKEFHY